MVRRASDIIMHKTLVGKDGIKFTNEAPFHGRIFKEDGQVIFELKPGKDSDELEFVRDEFENAIIIRVKEKEQIE